MLSKKSFVLFRVLFIDNLFTFFNQIIGCGMLNMVVCVSCHSISQQLGGPGQTAELVTPEKKIQWRIETILGNSDVAAHFKVCSGKLRL